MSPCRSDHTHAVGPDLPAVQHHLLQRQCLLLRGQGLLLLQVRGGHRQPGGVVNTVHARGQRDRCSHHDPHFVLCSSNAAGVVGISMPAGTLTGPTLDVGLSPILIFTWCHRHRPLWRIRSSQAPSSTGAPSPRAAAATRAGSTLLGVLLKVSSHPSTSPTSSRCEGGACLWFTDILQVWGEFEFSTSAVLCSSDP